MIGGDVAPSRARELKPDPEIRYCDESVAPSRARELKLRRHDPQCADDHVAPSRARELKRGGAVNARKCLQSRPHGRVS